MKGNKIMVLLWIVIALFLSAILVKSLTKKGGEKWPFKHVTIISTGICDLYETKEFSADSIKDIDVNLASESFSIEGTDGNKVIVELYCNKETVPEVKVEGKSLNIKSVPKHVINVGHRKVVVKVPEGFNFGKGEVSVLSGSVSVEDCNAGNINIDSHSGSVRIESVNSEKAEIKSLSGSVHVDKVTAENICIKSTSGSINAEDLNCKKLKVNSSSGSVHVDLDSPLLEDSEIQATSGSIRVNMPSNSNCKIRYNCTSGTYSNSLSGTRGKSGSESIGNGGPELDLNCTSGSIHVN